MAAPKRVKVLNRPRSDDLAALRLLALRFEGLSFGAIAARLGVPKHQVRDQLKKIREDDMAVPDLHAPETDYRRYYP